MFGTRRTEEEVRRHYETLDAIQKEYQRKGDSRILWREYDELVNMSKSALKSKAKYTLHDFDSAARDIALLIIEKMRQGYVRYPGALAKSYAMRFVTQIYAESFEAVKHSFTVSRETIEEGFMSNLSAFIPNHLHTPVGQLYALQILAQEQLGLGPTVPPEEINRYLSRKIKLKKGETYLLESDFSCVFNWDQDGKHGIPWKLWLTQRLEQLSRMTVTKLDKSISMPVYAFQYLVYTFGKLSEIGIRIKSFGNKKDIFTRPRLSYVRERGTLEGVFEPMEDKILIFDKNIIGQAVNVFKVKEKGK
jgi:hypothetical protein